MDDIMAKYIEKSAIVAEIEKRRRDWRYGSSIEAKYKREECDDILSFLDTLEVKDVDLDNELDFVKDAYYYFTSDERSSMKKVAKHFFELGLKAQKGE